MSGSSKQKISITKINITHPPERSTHQHYPFSYISVNTRRKITETLYKMAQRNKQCLKITEPLSISMKPKLYTNLAALSEKCVSIEMSRNQEKQIRDMIKAGSLERRYTKFVDKLMEEVKEEYVKVTKYASLNMKLKQKWDVYVLTEPAKNLARTKNYQNFLNTRKIMEVKWNLSHPIQHIILDECIQHLPKVLLELKFDKTVDIKELTYALNERIQNASHTLFQLHLKLSKIIDKDFQCNLRQLRAATTLFAINVSHIVSNTLNYTADHVEIRNVIPFLKLHTAFEDQLIIQPTCEELIHLYHECMDKFIEVTSHLFVFQKRRAKSEKQTINLFVTKEYIETCKVKLRENIRKLYDPIINYVNKLSEKFDEVYKELASENESTLADICFEVGLEKIKYYKQYILKVTTIPDNEYFKLGQLNLKNYREKIHNAILSVIDLIFKKISLQHLWCVNDICDSFHIIYSRATQVPITTEELIETGKFMNWVRSEQLHTLNKKVSSSLKSLCQIITLGTLSDEHMRKNVAAIKWPGKIVGTVEQFLTNFEQLKFEAEDNLQKVIEDVNVQILDVHPLLVTLDSMDNVCKAKEYLSTITLHMTKIKQVHSVIEWINKEEISLSFPKSNYVEFENLKRYVYPFYHLLKLCLDVQRHVSLWEYGSIELLDYESATSTVEEICTELTTIQKEYRKWLRQAQDDNTQQRFKGTVDDPDMLNWPAPLKLCAAALKIMEGFKPSLNVMKIICNDSLRPRHWKAMSEIAGFDITPNAGSTLKKMMQIDFHAQIKNYEIISFSATKEDKIFQELCELKDQWKRVNFSLRKDCETKIIFIENFNEIKEFVGDHNMKILIMRGSVFAEPYHKEIKEYADIIEDMDLFIKLWDFVQNQCLKLKPVISVFEDDVGLSNERNLFNIIFEIYNNHVEIILNNNGSASSTLNASILNDLKSCLAFLEDFNHGLASFLNSIRSKFPRLHFLGNDEILVILSGFNNLMLSVSPYLYRIFPGADKFLTDDKNILGMVSRSSEEFLFRNPVDLNNRYTMEELLQQVEAQMVASLEHQISNCYKLLNYTNFHELMHKYPQQAITVGSQLYLTRTVEESLTLKYNIKLRILQNKLKNGIKESIQKINQMGENLKRNIVQNLTIIHQQYIEIISKLLNFRYVNEENFDWKVHIRYYYENGICNMKILHHQTNYGYEYLGNQNQIILTPLTEKCYVTLLNAYFMNYSGFLVGDYQTGKLTTLKSLAQTFGKLFHYFGIEIKTLQYEIIRRLLYGSFLCGSWILLENCAIMMPEIFSVITQDLLKFSKAPICKSRDDDKILDGHENKFFFCMASTKNEYNVDIPENIRMLFRTFAFSTPDLNIVIEMLLMVDGFKNYVILTKKIVTLVTALQELLSQVNQHIFSAKHIKTFIKLCAKQKIEHHTKDEFEIVSVCFDEFFRSMIKNFDLNQFNNLLRLIFPNRQISDKTSNEDMKKTVEDLCSKSNLQCGPQLLLKLGQFYDGIKQHKYIFVIGQVFTAKSTTIGLCAELYKQLDDKNVDMQVINAKYLTEEHLYGSTDLATLSWTDGIVSKILRDSKNLEEGSGKWMIFDCAIDPYWIEYLYTMMKHKGKFLLSNGEILSASTFCSIIFETLNLYYATPSMISLCEVLYLDTAMVSWQFLIHSWMKSKDMEWLQDYESQFVDLLFWFIPPCLEFVGKQCKKLCPVPELSLVLNLLDLTCFILDDALSQCSKKDDDLKYLTAWIQASLLQAGLWSFGSVLDLDYLQKFEEFYKNLWKGSRDDPDFPKSIEKLDIVIPQECLLFDYRFIYKQRGNWKLWTDLLKNEKATELTYSGEIIVSTVETMCFNYFLDLHIKFDKPFLLMGSPQTGKSTFFRHFIMDKLSEDEYEKIICDVDKPVSPNKIQNLVLPKFNKLKAKQHLKPSSKIILFLDDLHLASTDSYSSIPNLELLRHFMDYHTWFDVKTKKFVKLENCQLIVSANICKEIKDDDAGQSRLLRHFNMFSINKFTNDTIVKIYSTILLGSWKNAGLPTDIISSTTQFVTSSNEIYQMILNELKPTLSNPHYIFSLSSFAQMIHNFTYLKKESFDLNKKVHIKLWAHEILRNFGDRLESLDCDWLEKNIIEYINESFKESFQDIFENLSTNSNNDEQTEANISLSNLFFTMHKQPLGGCPRYEEISSWQDLLNTYTTNLIQHNENSKFKLDITLFTFVVKQLAKLNRILSLPSCNALLLGANGCGRQSLTKLASFINETQLFQAVLTENYDLNSWTSDIKTIFKKSGALNERYVMLLTEEEILQGNFLELINFYLKNSNVIDLYDPEETLEILELTRLSAQGGNRFVDVNTTSVFMFFNKRCRLNLHIILCLSQSSLRHRLQNYKHLTNCHIILWTTWPDAALEEVSRKWIANVDISKETKEKVVTTSLNCYRTFNDINYYNSPISYIHFLKLFSDVTTKKQETLKEKKKRYLQGLAKLSYAATQIFNMQEALARYQPQLEEMTENARQMTEQIALETIEVEKASALIKKDEKVASEQALIAQALKSECESELAQAIPILEDAISALNTLKPSDITLVKSMKNPPDAIKLVMASVCVIKDLKPDRIPDPSTGRKLLDYWGPSKRVLGDMNFLQSLKDFDKDHIKPEIMAKIRKEYLCHKDFKPQVVAKASSAAEGLCKWIIAMDMYDMVAKEVAPKKEKLNKAEKEYAATMKILNEKKEEVAKIEEKLVDLNNLLKEATKKQSILQEEVDICNRKLRSAQKLIGGLSGEKLRWTESVEKLQTYYDTLAGDVLLACATIAYLPRFKTNLRRVLMEQFQHHITNSELQVSTPFDIAQVLSTESEVVQWQQNGLPEVVYFTINGIIKKYSKLNVIIMDPHFKASKWIKRTEKGNGIKETTFTNENYMSVIKSAVIFGHPLLITSSTDDIPKCLISLMKSTFLDDATPDNLLMLDGETVEIHKDFNMYFCCRKQNLKLPFYIFTKMTVLNFALNESAFIEEFLNVLIKIERPDIKSFIRTYIQKTAQNKAELKNLEDKILNTLCTSETDILEDEGAIVILDESKDLVTTARKKQEETSGMEEIITTCKNEYKLAAIHATNLFYYINKLHKLEYMYQYSLEWYVTLYFSCIINSPRADTVKSRCEKLISTLNYDVYKQITRGIIQKHRIFFSFLLAISNLKTRGNFDDDELFFFLEYDYTKSKFDLNCLHKLRSFEGFVESFSQNEERWKQAISMNFEEIPSPWDKLNDLCKLILNKIFNSGQLYEKICDFIKGTIGKEFIDYYHINLEEVLYESNNMSPIMFIQTSGTDPLVFVNKLAITKKYLHKFHYMSFGEESSENEVDVLIEEGRQKGYWVVLRNCHFATRWTEKFIKNLDNTESNTHENFRLWLTTSPSNDFPLELLQNSIKIVDELPDGLKQNKLRLLRLNADEFHDGCGGNRDKFIRFLYSFCQFHTVLNEKNKFYYGNVSTQFVDSDFYYSVKQMKEIITRDKNILEGLLYLVGQNNYSGYLHNEWDKLYIMELLGDYFNKKILSIKYEDLKLYGFPVKNDYEDYVNQIHKLQENDPIEALHISNSHYYKSLSFKTKLFFKNSSIFFNKILDSDLSKSEQNIYTITEDIIKNLPENLEAFNADQSDYVITREVSRYNILLAVIKESLSSLKNTLGSVTTLSPEFESFTRDLISNKIPKLWYSFSCITSHGLSKYLTDLNYKVQFFRGLLAKNDSVYWLSAFYFPNSLLAQKKIEFSEKTSMQIEELKFDYSVDVSDTKSDNEFLVKGFILLGAKWDQDKNSLAELTPNIIQDALPPVTFQIIQKRGVIKESRFRCTVYRSHKPNAEYSSFSSCENFITSIFLPTITEPSFWTKRCVKVICEGVE